MNRPTSPYLKTATPTLRAETAYLCELAIWLDANAPTEDDPNYPGWNHADRTAMRALSNLGIAGDSRWVRDLRAECEQALRAIRAKHNRAE